MVLHEILNIYLKNSNHSLSSKKNVLKKALMRGFCNKDIIGFNKRLLKYAVSCIKYYYSCDIINYFFINAINIIYLQNMNY